MLRAAVIALLLGNLLLAGYRAAYPPQVPPSPVVPGRALPTDLAGIALVQELGQPSESGQQGLRCFTLGPFETAASMQDAQIRLRDQAARIRERRTEALMELGYWVALPPVAEFAEAAAAERDLRRLGLEDIAVVSGPEGDFQISLGYFLDEGNALMRRDRVRELGFEAETRLQRETQTRYWLDYEITAKERGKPARRFPWPGSACAARYPAGALWPMCRASPASIKIRSLGAPA